MNSKNFSLKKAVKSAFNSLSNPKNLFILWGTWILTSIISTFLIGIGIATFLGGSDLNQMIVTRTIPTLSFSGIALGTFCLATSILIYVIVSIWVCTMMLEIAKTGTTSLKASLARVPRAFFEYLKLSSFILLFLGAEICTLIILKAILPAFLFPILAVISGIATVIFSIIFFLAAFFTPHIIIDQNKSAFDALMESIKMTRGIRWKLFWVFVLVGVLVSVLSMFVVKFAPFFLHNTISLLWGIFLGLIFVHIYYDLKKQSLTDTTTQTSENN